MCYGIAASMMCTMGESVQLRSGKVSTLYFMFSFKSFQMFENITSEVQYLHPWECSLYSLDLLVVNFRSIRVLHGSHVDVEGTISFQRQSHSPCLILAADRVHHRNPIHVRPNYCDALPAHRWHIYVSWPLEHQKPPRKYTSRKNCIFHTNIYKNDIGKPQLQYYISFNQTRV